MNVTELRGLGHRAVTEGVNLKYVEQMRRALYEAADRIEDLEAAAGAVLAYESRPTASALARLREVLTP